VEMALAALALIIWLHATPGLGRTVAFNVILIGGVSTLLFNGNPLLRFDGYYILSDLIEIPNLGSRSSAYLLYLLQKIPVQKSTACTARSPAGVNRNGSPAMRCSHSFTGCSCRRE